MKTGSSSATQEKNPQVGISANVNTRGRDRGLVRLADYYTFIKESDGKLAERFFDSNVRGYWPSSHINSRIAETLKGGQQPRVLAAE